MPNDLNLRVPASSAPIWENWSGNLVHRPATDGGNYYFMPTNLAELRAVVAHAASEPGATVRVSGQRHSQPPLSSATIVAWWQHRRPRRIWSICHATGIWDPVRIRTSC